MRRSLVLISILLSVTAICFFESVKVEPLTNDQFMVIAIHLFAFIGIALFVIMPIIERFFAGATAFWLAIAITSVIYLAAVQYSGLVAYLLTVSIIATAATAINYWLNLIYTKH